jgi:hypothetical protein
MSSEALTKDYEFLDKTPEVSFLKRIHIKVKIKRKKT